jgi:hypothetical protein
VCTCKKDNITEFLKKSNQSKLDEEEEDFYHKNKTVIHLKKGNHTLDVHSNKTSSLSKHLKDGKISDRAMIVKQKLINKKKAALKKKGTLKKGKALKKSL